jgi:tetratricopeptide (TPR) repeat protein
MALTEAAELMQKGLLALEHGHSFLAMTYLEQAMRYGKTPVVSSYLAYCYALNGRDLDKSIELGREALQADPANPEFSLNLGRVLHLSGRKDEAIAVFRQGLAYSLHPELIAHLEKLGTRKPPLFRSLPRGHFLNRFGGQLLSMLGFR